MGKMYRPSEKLIKDMTTPEIKAWLDGLDKSEIMRSIILAEVKAIEQDEPRYQRTIRGLWYDTVKPTLSRAGILNEKTSGGKAVDWAAYLSRYTAELVRVGMTGYQQLKIVDTSRRRQQARDITASVIDVDMVGGHFPWLILFTEKDTIYGVLQSLADLYGVSVISGGGYPAFSCTDPVVREIIASDAFQDANQDRLILLAVSDYDPEGGKIAKRQAVQIAETAQTVDDSLGVDFVRMGIFPSQLTPEETAQNKYDYKDPESTKALEWWERTGGINGEKLGLELDALPLYRLRDIFSQEIEKQIDISKREADLREAVIDILACELLTPDFQEKRKAMIKAVKDNELWGDIESKELPGDLFRRAAVKGKGYITPEETKELFAEYLEDVIEEMRDALE